MALESVLVLDAVSRFQETLGCTAFGFHFWHVRILRIQLINITARPAVPWWLFLFLGCDDHDQLASFHLRMLFDRTVFHEVTFNPLQQFHTQLLVGHLTTAKSQGNLGPVPITQETYQVA
ncbi:hypothetical protein D3C80_1799800 [compost metagenome]